MKYIYITNGRADKAAQYQDFFQQLKDIPHLHEVYTTLGEGDATRYVRLYCDLHPDEEVCFVACGGNGIINGVASRANELVAAGKSAHQAYTRGVMNAFLTSRFNRIKIMVDGKRIVRGSMLLCTVANGQRVGGEFNCAPNAKVDDGLMDVCFFRAMSLLRLLMLIPLYRSGKHIGSRPGKNKVLYRQAREVTISSKDLIDIYIDGEQLPGSQFHLKILPGALPLRLPKIH